MKSLFDSQPREEILRRLENLHADSKAKWGKFDAGRMLAHVIDTFEACFAERRITVSKNMFNTVIGRWMVIDGPVPWPKGAPTSPELFVTQPGEFLHDKQRVIDYIKRLEKGPNQTFGPSPYLGKLTPGQWSRLHYRHLDHHLKQFGL